MGKIMLLFILMICLLMLLIIGAMYANEDIPTEFTHGDNPKCIGYWNQQENKCHTICYDGHFWFIYGYKQFCYLTV